MKKSIAVAVIVMASLTVNAQQAGGKSGGQGGGGPGGQGGQQHQRPSPQQMTEQLMSKFDADKDGKLDQGELTQALTALRAHRPQGGGQGGPGQGGGASAGGQQHRGPGGGGEAGGAQGGPGGQHHGLAGDGQGQQGAGQGGAKAERPMPPPASEVAAKMIEKFAADKKGLTQAELATALAAHRPPQGGPGGHHGGPQGGPQGAPQGGAGSAK